MTNAAWRYALLGLAVLYRPAWALNGTADLKGTAPGSQISGTVTLTDTAGGLQVSARVMNAPPGPHGFHIHEFGQCGDAGKAAGDHYNPLSAPHGQVLKDGLQKAHAGDLGNVEVGSDGRASLETVIPGLALASGKYTVAGRSFVLHEKVDDFSQPLGNAGGRIACGPILLTAVGK